MNEEKFVWYCKDETNLKHIDFKDKDAVTRLLIGTMLTRTNSMFEWKGLPKTIPQHYLELVLQTNGNIGIIEHEGKYFAVYGNAGGMRNYNYEPSLFVVSNPYLMIQSKMYEIFYGNDAEIDSPQKPPKTDGKCVVIVNDPMYRGLIPLSQYYSSQLTENTITKRMVSIISRIMYVFAAGDEDIKKDFDDLIKDVERGEIKAILAEGFLGDGVNNAVATLPLSDKAHEALTDLIENEQYIKASWLNDLGLQANYNMKRESINSNESQLNKDAVLPLVDTMLAMRKLACKRINELYGLNWSVDFSSAWKYTRTTIEQAIEAIDDNDQPVGQDKSPNQLDEEIEDKEVVEDEET